MNKMVFFVEGQTEMLFVKHLIEQIAESNQINIDMRRLHGSRNNRRIIELNTSNSNGMYYFLIYDSCGDHNVKTDMMENYESLCAAGYEKIVVLRDLYPIPRSDAQKLFRNIKYGVKTKPIEVDFVFSIMEIEAWFIGEHHHFSKMDPSLTRDMIKSSMNYDIVNDDSQSIDLPANFLHEAYQLASLSYNKSQEDVTAIMNVLDWDYIYVELREKIQPLKKLICCIEEFMA